MNSVRVSEMTTPSPAAPMSGDRLPKLLDVASVPC